MLPLAFLITPFYGRPLRAYSMLRASGHTHAPRSSAKPNHLPPSTHPSNDLVHRTSTSPACVCPTTRSACHHSDRNLSCFITCLLHISRKPRKPDQRLLCSARDSDYRYRKVSFVIIRGLRSAVTQIVDDQCPFSILATCSDVASVVDLVLRMARDHSNKRVGLQLQCSSTYRSCFCIFLSLTISPSSPKVPRASWASSSTEFSELKNLLINQTKSLVLVGSFPFTEFRGSYNRMPQSQ